MMWFFDDLLFILIIFIKLDEFVGVINYLIYIYGYYVYIFKVFYLEVDEEIGIIVKVMFDIRCVGKDCKYLSWEKEEWVGGNVLDLNLWNLFLKDIVVVLRMGYVVFWFFLDNLGIWKIVKCDKIFNVVRIIYYVEILLCFVIFCKVFVVILWVYLFFLEEKFLVCINLFRKFK